MFSGLIMIDRFTLEMYGMASLAVGQFSFLFRYFGLLSTISCLHCFIIGNRLVIHVICTRL